MYIQSRQHLHVRVGAPGRAVVVAENRELAVTFILVCEGHRNRSIFEHDQRAVLLRPAGQQPDCRPRLTFLL